MGELYLSFCLSFRGVLLSAFGYVFALFGFVAGLVLLMCWLVLCLVAALGDVGDFGLNERMPWFGWLMFCLVVSLVCVALG